MVRRGGITRITIIKVHQAKSLEFDNVFIVGLEEGIFPHSMCLYSPSEIEEERRLCYVAITRARKNLSFVNSKKQRIDFSREWVYN